jgi:hypothetical protein
MRHKWKALITENISYKLVSLFISLILWLTILGRRDFSLSKSFELDFLPASNQLVQYQSASEIKVKVSGPRAALKRMIESGLSPIVSVDVSRRAEGEYDINIPADRIDVPFGVKIVSIKPEAVRIRISKKE